MSCPLHCESRQVHDTKSSKCFGRCMPISLRSLVPLNLSLRWVPWLWVFKPVLGVINPRSSSNTFGLSDRALPLFTGSRYNLVCATFLVSYRPWRSSVTLLPWTVMTVYGSCSYYFVNSLSALSYLSRTWSPMFSCLCSALRYFLALSFPFCFSIASRLRTSMSLVWGMMLGSLVRMEVTRHDLCWAGFPNPLKQSGNLDSQCLGSEVTAWTSDGVVVGPISIVAPSPNCCAVSQPSSVISEPSGLLYPNFSVWFVFRKLTLAWSSPIHGNGFLDP